MFERFTRPAREVVHRATMIALDSRASQVRPEHLFAALLWDDGCAAVEVLVGMGTSLDRLHGELDRRRARYVDGLDDEDAAALAGIGIDLAAVVARLDDPPPGRRPGRTRLGFARSTKKVLELSLREAVALERGHIGTEHLLLGIIREGDPLVRATLVAAGVVPDEVRRALVDAVRRVG